MKKIQFRLDRKIIINSAICLALVLASLSAARITQNAYADKSIDELGREIEALQSEINDAEKQASELNNQSKTLQNELAGVEKDKQVIQAQIDISQAQYDKLQLEIKETENKITDNRKALGFVLAEMSLEDDVSPIERIAGSDNISTALDKFEYKSAVKTTLTEKVGQIKKLKIELEEKRDEVKISLTNQKKSEEALQAKISEQSKLIEQTKGEEAEYKKYASERNSEQKKLQDAQQKAIEAAMRPPAGGGGNISLPGNSGGYPWNDSNCYVDANAVSHGGSNGNGEDGMGYGCRQCVSYVAWKVYREKGFAPVYWGNANNWPASARNAGYTTGPTPRVGSAAVISAGAYGHIVWVEAIEGSDVIISQYNYFNQGGPGWGHYSKMRVSAATYDTYIYF